MSAGALRKGPGRSAPSVEDDACRQSGSSPPARAIPLPSPADLATVPPEEVPSLIAHFAALMAALAPRLAVVVAAPTIQPTQPRLATAKEVAAAFSLRVDRVYELARTRSIPSVHVGKRAMRFDIEAVRKALDS
jgi:hypothetical protein